MLCEETGKYAIFVGSSLSVRRETLLSVSWGEVEAKINSTHDIQPCASRSFNQNLGRFLRA